MKAIEAAKKPRQPAHRRLLARRAHQPMPTRHGATHDFLVLNQRPDLTTGPARDRTDRQAETP